MSDNELPQTEGGRRFVQVAVEFCSKLAPHRQAIVVNDVNALAVAVAAGEKRVVSPLTHAIIRAIAAMPDIDAALEIDADLIERASLATFGAYCQRN